MMKYALRKKQVSDYCIKKALATIDEKEYLIILQKLMEAKRKALKGEKVDLARKRKLQVYLLLRGFEADLVREMM